MANFVHMSTISKQLLKIYYFVANRLKRKSWMRTQKCILSGFEWI